MWTHFATLLLVGLLSAVAVNDVRTMRIPDWLNLGVLFSGLGVSWALGRSLVDAALGAVAGYAAIWLIAHGYRTLRKRDGIGMGDAKLMAGAGAWLGWAGLPFVVLIGSASGLAFVALLAVLRRKINSTDEIAFGPFLCVGVFAVWVVQAYA